MKNARRIAAEIMIALKITIMFLRLLLDSSMSTLLEPNGFNGSNSFGSKYKTGKNSVP